MPSLSPLPAGHGKLPRKLDTKIMVWYSKGFLEMEIPIVAMRKAVTATTYYMQVAEQAPHALHSAPITKSEAHTLQNQTFWDGLMATCMSLAGPTTAASYNWSSKG